MTWTWLFRLVANVVTEIVHAVMTMPGAGAVVGLDTWTETETPWARFPNAQLRVWAGAAPLIAQPTTAGVIDQR